MERIGFIGLGAMGGALAANLARKGHPLRVYDLNPAAVQRLVDAGASAAESIGELTRDVDIVITCLPDSPQVEAVILGPDGVAENARPDQLVMETSTVDPATTDKVAAALGEQGIAFVDSPIGRTVAFAERGEALFMVGASGNDLGRIKPVLESMGSTIHHCGGAGRGIRTKLVNNYISILVCQIDAEAFALATAFGLDPKDTLDVVNGTTGTNGHLQFAWPAKVLAGDCEPGFSIALATKDVRLGIAAARAAGVPVFMGASGLETLSQACREGWGDKDFSALLDRVCAQAGIEPPRLDPAGEPD